MPRALFVYGTLRDPELLAAVLGHAVDARNVLAATAPGFRAAFYPGRIYPGLVRAPGGVAEGLLLLGLTTFDFDLLDAFEGDEYTRGIVPVITDQELHEADSYLPNRALPADAADWSFAIWQQRHKPAVLSADAAAAAELRARLIAIRPN